MSWQKMLFVVGLMTLLTLSHAGGDHTKGHGKDRDYIKGGSDPVEEGILPLPYSFDIKTGTPYGTRISREEVGGADGTVKGFYTIDNPRGTKRIVEYTADDSGFHANIKTSEPNIKSHNPSNVVIEAISPTGSRQRVVGKPSGGLGLHHAAVLPVLQNPNIGAAGSEKSAVKGGVKTIVTPGVAPYAPVGLEIRESEAFPVLTPQLRQPIAIPNQPQNIASNPNYRRKVIKTIRRKLVVPKPSDVEESTGPRDVSKTVSKESTEALSDSRRVAPAPVKGGNVNIVLEDGSILDAADVSDNLGIVPESVEKSKSVKINQDVRYSRGPQIPFRDRLRPNDQTREIPSDRKLILNKQEQSTILKTSGIQVSANEGSFRPRNPEGSIVIPGGPGGSPISLTQDEIQNILSSGGVIEFPDGPAAGSFEAKEGFPSQKQILTPVSPRGVVRTQMKKQLDTQTLRVGKPKVRTPPEFDIKKIDTKSQTSFISSQNTPQISMPKVSANPIIVPGGPGGTSLSFTEAEIQSILSSGGVVDFPSDSSAGPFGQKDVVTSEKQTLSIPKQKVPSIPQTSNLRKQTTGITPTFDGKINLNSRPASVGDQKQKTMLSSGPITVPGGPGGASLSLTEAEIQGILSSGGILDFPSNPSQGYGVRDILVSQNKPIDVPRPVTVTRFNTQSITQNYSGRKPATRITSTLDKKIDLKTQTYYRSGPIGAQVLRSRGPITVPGGPGGASLSLTEAEIQGILSSGGVLDFPSNPSLGYRPRGVLTSQNKPAKVSGAVTVTQSNIQSVTQTSSARKPASRFTPDRNVDLKTQTYFRPGPIRPQEPKSRGTITVPGGPGGASLSFTEDEIQNILSSGGVLDFPSNPTTGYRPRDVLIPQKRPENVPGAVTVRQSNLQTVTQTSSARKPAARITPDRNIDLKPQTYYRPTPIKPEVPKSGGSITVPGGPGGASLSFTEDEIQNILSSGGVLDFPSNPSQGYFSARDVSIPQNQPAKAPQLAITSRSNLKAITQTPTARQPPISNTPSLEDRKNIGFISQTSLISEPNAPQTPTGPIVVSGGPGGTSLSLTEAEIQNILSSGGIVDFPSDSEPGILGAKDVITPPKQLYLTLEDSKPKVNEQTIPQFSSERKPSTRITSKVDKKTDFKTQIFTRPGPAGTQMLRPGLSRGPIIIPGGPGGSSLSLNEAEIQNILSSGGVVDFPSDSAASVFGARDILTAQKQPSPTLGYAKPKEDEQSITQVSRRIKPATGIISTIEKKTESKIQTFTRSGPTGTQGIRPGLSRGPIVIPGGPGGTSLSLTQDEIQNILSSGGVIDFPSDSNAGSFEAKDILISQKKSSIIPEEITRTGTNKQSSSQTPNSDIPASKIISDVDSKSTTKPLDTFGSVKPKPLDVNRNIFNRGSSQRNRPSGLYPTSQTSRGSSIVTNQGSQVLTQNYNQRRNELLRKQTPVVTQENIESVFQPENQSPQGYNPEGSNERRNNIPAENPSYIRPSSFMVPFDYQSPEISVLKTSNIPFNQEQEKLEQIFI